MTASAPPSSDGAAFDAVAELDRQLATVVEAGYANLPGLSEQALTRLVRPLREVVAEHAGAPPAPTRDRLPLVLVIPRRLAPAELSMPLTRHGRKPGFVSGDTADIGRFQPIDGVDVPDADVYLLVDVERGDDYRNATPDAALAAITARGRTPLTYDEGIAVVTQSPQSLEKNHCFSLVASRCGDRRVPALWISGGAPKLGWCWAGNPHTWLGSASCAARVAASQA
jgi:hypothetical protein